MDDFSDWVWENISKFPEKKGNNLQKLKQELELEAAAMDNLECKLSDLQNKKPLEVNSGRTYILHWSAQTRAP